MHHVPATRVVEARDVGLVNEEVQWFVNGAAAMDGIFSSNDSYHDSQLAYDFRGTMGVRACPAIEGDGELHSVVLHTLDDGEDDDTILLLS